VRGYFFFCKIILGGDMMEIENFLRNKVLDYSFYDEQHNLIAVLNKQNLKELLKVDEILLEEREHK
jgi:hypothetical protein